VEVVPRRSEKEMQGMRDRNEEAPKKARSSMREAFRKINLMPANVSLATWKRLKIKTVAIDDKKRAKAWLPVKTCKGVAWKP